MSKPVIICLCGSSQFSKKKIPVTDWRGDHWYTSCWVCDNCGAIVARYETPKPERETK